MDRFTVHQYIKVSLRISRLSRVITNHLVVAYQSSNQSATQSLHVRSSKSPFSIYYVRKKRIQKIHTYREE